MAIVCWLYFVSKFTEFADTFFFIARKKFAHVSMLQVTSLCCLEMSKFDIMVSFYTCVERCGNLFWSHFMKLNNKRNFVKI